LKEIGLTGRSFSIQAYFRLLYCRKHDINITENHEGSQGRQSSDTDTNFGLPEFQIGVRTIQPQFWVSNDGVRRSQWLHGLRSGCAAARLLGLWVRIPPWALYSVSCECCVLGRGLCVGLITRPEEFHRV